MDFVQRALRNQRIVLAGTIAASVLLFWRGSLDIFNTVKATAIALGLLVVVALGAVRVARTRVLSLPATPLLLPAGALAAALIVATMVADQTMLSVVGRPGRHTGLAMYLVYLALLVLAARLHAGRAPVELAGGLLLATVPVALYGVLQMAGLDPWGWGAVEGGPQVFATFGNANFFAAFLGIMTPLGLGFALHVRRSRAWMGLCIAVAVAGPLLGFASGSLQGPIVAVIGAALVVVVWLWTDARVSSAARVGASAMLGAGGALLTVMLVLGVGPFGAIREAITRSLVTRMGKWETAAAMVADRPLLGFGLDRFEDWFFAYRPRSVAAETGLLRSTDAPHMVPLEMFVSGGVLLGLAYIVFVLATAWALVMGLRRLNGRERVLLAGVGGAWLAYQVQSLVSIDVPPIAVLHYVLAGVLIGWGAGSSVRRVRLPGAPGTDLRRAPSSRGKARRLERVSIGPLRPAVVVFLGVVALVAAWVVTTPLRADLAAGQAARLVAAERPSAADAAWERAGATAFWEPQYPAHQADLAKRQGDPALARRLHEEAARRQPRGIAHQVNIARESVALGDHDRARRAYARLLELDPSTPDILVEVGRFELEHGEVLRARELLERAVTLREEADWWSALGDARAADGDVPEARLAYERALRIDPSAAGAQDGLESLGDPPVDGGTGE